MTHIILPNENLDSVPRLLKTAARYPDRISLALGLHPEDVHDDWDDVLDQMETLFDRHPWVAIGEVGIDLYWDKTFHHEQMQALERQLGWCVDRDLPFILHCREALDDMKQLTLYINAVEGMVYYVVNDDYLSGNFAI